MVLIPHLEINAKNLFTAYFAIGILKTKANKRQKGPATGVPAVCESYNNVVTRSHWKTPTQSDLHVLNNLLLLLYTEAGIKPLS